jgi:hypothetical protein
MAGELATSGPGTGKTVYCLVFQGNTGKVWNTGTNLFETYTNVNYANYTISLVEQGGSNIYVGNFPAAIAAGVYGILAKQQLTGSPLQSDPNIGNEDFQWNGTAPSAISDTATSGLLAGTFPTEIARSFAVKPFNFKLVSSADHLSNFTSGVVSGQISRDGGAFGPLQSGNILEIGLGHYSLPNGLTSGDLNARTISLVFTAVGISGFSADQRDFVFITQRNSGV